MQVKLAADSHAGGARMHVCDVLVAGVIRVVTNGIGSNGGAAAAGGHEAVPVSIFGFDQFLVLDMDAFLQAVRQMVLQVAPRPSSPPAAACSSIAASHLMSRVSPVFRTCTNAGW